MTHRPLKPSFLAALPFFAALGFVPIIAVIAVYGGSTGWLGILYGSVLISVLDVAFGLDREGYDPETSDRMLFWYRMVTWIWAPVQLLMIPAVLIWIAATDHLSASEEFVLALNVGFACGVVGVVFAHELFHQAPRWERALGEALMISVLYGHFVTEHLKVHHIWVATPCDAATARYNESFFAFLPRVLIGSLLSAWRTEADMLRRVGRPVWDRSNPFWRYFGGSLLALALAFAIGGLWGLSLYLVIAWIAVVVLEHVNYLEHYGLTRRALADGKYEPVRPHHSWNAAHKISNYLLINLQRHSDHHIKPGRRYPLLQSHDDAPQLPLAYPLMVAISVNPWLWRRVMNPKVRKWRAMYYPDVTDWRPEAARQSAD